MRKHITANRSDVAQHRPDASQASRWLDLEQLATVEVTSEDSSHPIEAALVAGPASGWRASSAGEQVVRLRLDTPQQVRRLRLRFDDRDSARTQEFVIRYSRRGETEYRDIVRQQFTFSPGGATRQEEDYAVDLADVVALELRIVPNIAGGSDRATLTEWRVGA